MFSYIIWNFNPDIITSPLAIRWYGVFFALGFLISQQVLFHVYKKEAGTDLKKQKDAEQLVEAMTIYMILATIIGARLGHVMFYQPMDYLAEPWRILNLREGGLASHGAAIGILTALWIFSKYKITVWAGGPTWKVIKFNRGYNYLQIVDRIVIVVAICAMLIRFGNFTNSEIIGKPTHSDWGVVFARQTTDYLGSIAGNSSWVEDIDYRKDDSRELDENGYVPIIINMTFKNNGYSAEDIDQYLNETVNRQLSRMGKHIHEPLMHNLDSKVAQLSDGRYGAQIATYGIARQPSQLYESISSLLLAILLFAIWNRMKSATPPGLLLGIFLVVCFGLRFVYEFTKENQVAFEDNIPLNMGQWLSIPLFVIGVGLLINAMKKKEA